ncbi:MAG: TusE/DsrC/DsvC family sulfur relay protein [Chromatiaceae bacterium]|nr:TusE/DsrC/DsvC family sulfur relay protein [Chromatiaceae bacterium]
MGHTSALLEIGRSTGRLSALKLVEAEQLTLEEVHWGVMHFMRSYYAEHWVASDARFVIKYLTNEGGEGRDAKSVHSQVYFNLNYGLECHNEGAKAFPLQRPAR